MNSLRSFLRRNPRVAATPSAFAALCLAGMSVTSNGAILIDADGITLDFAAAPGAGDWSTITGGIAGNGPQIGDGVTMDATVAALLASNIADALPTSGTFNPVPSTNTAGRYNTALLALQTRPTNVAASVLMARLQNANAAPIDQLSLSYTLGRLFDPAGASIVEQLDGHYVYFSLTGAANSWVRLNALSGDGVAGLKSLTFSTPGWAANMGAFLLFVDDNADPGTDDAFTLDNMSFIPTLGSSAPIYTWNTAHVVGGAPGGSWEISGAQYWLDGATPAGFVDTAVASFSQDVTGTAAINVPADIAAAEMRVSHASGTYSFGGIGRIATALVKTNAGTLTFNSPNAFTSVTLSGGVTITADFAALGSNGIIVGGAATLQTDTDLDVGGGLSGTGPLVKTGAGTLTVGGAGSGTGGVTVQAGTLRAVTAAGLGSQNVALDGTTLSFVHAAGDQTFNSPTIPRTLSVGAAGATIDVENGTVGVGVIVQRADSFTGAGTITKTGGGFLRMRANQTTFTGDWIVNGGSLEYGTGLASALGSGLVTVNAGGELIGQNGVVPVASIVLNGGALGTRTGALTVFQGAINVVADSELRLRSASTPTGVQPFAISGVISGAGRLTVAGALPDVNGVIPTGNYAAPRDTEPFAVALTNTANSNTGGYLVTTRQFLSSEPAAGTGNTFGTGSIELVGGSIRVRDNGPGNSSTVVYGNNVSISQAAAPNDVPSIIDVNRQTTGIFTNNTISFGSLTIAAGSTLGTIGGNGYNVSFAGTTNVTGVGNVTFNPTTAPLILSGGLGAGGYGLVKTGTGLLAVAGGSHTGDTTVNGGTLSTTGQFANSQLITVGPGAVLDVTGVAGGFLVGSGRRLNGSGTVTGAVVVGDAGTISAPAGPFNIGNVTFGQAAGDIPRLSVTIEGAPGLLNVTSTNGLSTVSGAGGTKIFVSSATGLTVGATYTLINYDGLIGGDGFAGFSLLGLPLRTIANLVDNTVNTSIDLNVTGVDFPVWTGASSTEWSTNVIAGPKNWRENFSMNPTEFFNGDRVRFDDTASSGGVEINNGTVTVAGLVFDNATRDYTIAGTNGIAGNTGLSKVGAARLLLTTINSFTGNVTIDGGTLEVPSVSNAGIAGALGAGSIVSINGGTLEFSGASGSTNRSITLGGATGGTINATSGAILTLSGTVTGGAFTKAGAGTVILAGTANAPTSVTISAGTLQIGDGTSPAGGVGPGTITNNGTLVINNPNQITATNVVTGNGSVVKDGFGQLVLSGPDANTYTGVTTVNAGEVVLSKTSGINAIGGDLIINSGASVTYGTTAGQLQDHIPDTASITINGGTFGSGSGNTLAAPTAAITDTVANVTLNSGVFLSGRNGTVTPFTVTGTLALHSGLAFLQRGGLLTAQTVTVASGVDLSFDGGSTTAGQASTLTVGAGGITLDGVIVRMNTGLSGLAAGSQGSRITLNGPLTSTGDTTFLRVDISQLAPAAELDLGGASRTLDVTGTLTLGTILAPVSVVNGGLIKTGPGTLLLAGTNTYTGQTTIQQGTLDLDGSLSGSTPITVAAGASFDVAGVAGGFTLNFGQLLTGNGSVTGNVAVSGTLAPGVAGIGTLSFSSNLLLQPNATSNFQIAKAGVIFSADLANVAADLTLSGALNVTHSGDTLAAGDTFNLFDAATIFGDFTAYNLPPLSGDLTWDTTQMPISGTLTVVPEPAGAILLLGGLGLLGLRRRRSV